MEEKHALVLSGGGSLGAYAVGVTRGLALGRSCATGYRPFEPAIYTGTSVGAYNAAFLAARGDVPCAQAAAELEAAWLERISDQGDGRGNGVFRFRGDPFDLLHPWDVATRPLQTLRRWIEDGACLGWEGLQRAIWFLGQPGLSFEQLVELIDLSVFVALDPLEETLWETIDFESVRRSNRQLTIAATCWTTGTLELVRNADMNDRKGPDLTLASASIPGVFPPRVIDAREWVDGSVLMNTPLDPALSAGADVVHAIELFPQRASFPEQELRSSFSSMVRSQATTWDFLVEAEMRLIEDVNAILKILDHRRRQVEASETKRESREYAARQLDEVRSAYCERLVRLRCTPIEIHRYRPRRALDNSPLGILRFGRDRIERLIEQGFQDTVAHDCKDCGCIVPGEPAAAIEATEPRWG